MVVFKEVPLTISPASLSMEFSLVTEQMVAEITLTKPSESILRKLPFLAFSGTENERLICVCASLFCWIRHINNVKVNGSTKKSMWRYNLYISVEHEMCSKFSKQS